MSANPERLDPLHAPDITSIAEAVTPVLSCIIYCLRSNAGSITALHMGGIRFLKTKFW